MMPRQMCRAQMYRQLGPRSRLRTRRPRRRSVKEPVCVPCSPPFGKTRAALHLGGAEPLGSGYPSEASDGRLTNSYMRLRADGGRLTVRFFVCRCSLFVPDVDRGHVRPARQRQRPRRRHRLRLVAAWSTEAAHRGVPADRRRRRRASQARRLAASDAKSPTRRTRQGDPANRLSTEYLASEPISSGHLNHFGRGGYNLHACPPRAKPSPSFDLGLIEG